MIIVFTPDIYLFNVKADYTKIRAVPERTPTRTAIPTATTEFPVVLNPLLVVTVAQGIIDPVYVVVNGLTPIPKLPKSSTSTQTPSAFDVSRLQLSTTPK